MRNDSRLCRMLHVLIHLERHTERATSDEIAAMLGTNPVVVRRTMAGLRDAGHVRSEKGHGGGWSLARRLEDITLLDIYAALGEPALFAIGPANDDPECLVEQAVNARLETAMQEARALLHERLRTVTLADVANDFDTRLAATPHGRRRRAS